MGVIFGSFMIGAIVDNKAHSADRYSSLHMTLTLIAAAGFLLASYLCWYDEQHEGNLNAVMMLTDDYFTDTEASDQSPTLNNYVEDMDSHDEEENVRQPSCILTEEADA
jgi:hypothetical protein